MMIQFDPCTSMIQKVTTCKLLDCYFLSQWHLDPWFGPYSFNSVSMSHVTILLVGGRQKAILAWLDIIEDKWLPFWTPLCILTWCILDKQSFWLWKGNNAFRLNQLPFQTSCSEGFTQGCWLQDVEYCLVIIFWMTIGTYFTRYLLCKPLLQSLVINNSLFISLFNKFRTC